MSGICYGVSVGPGGTGLLTLEAAEIIRKADIIFLPSFPKEKCKAYIIAKKSVPDLDDKDLRCETFPMSRNAEMMPERHEEIFRNVVLLLEKGKNIAFLTLGEVEIYSTYLYIHEKLKAAGLPSRLINGVSSVQAVAARLGIALVCGNEELHVFPDTADLAKRLAYPGTRVFMKPKGELTETIEAIRQLNPSYAGGVSNCGLDNEIIANNIDDMDKLQGYFTVLIVK